MLSLLLGEADWVALVGQECKASHFLKTTQPKATFGGLSKDTITGILVFLYSCSIKEKKKEVNSGSLIKGILSS